MSEDNASQDTENEENTAAQSAADEAGAADAQEGEEKVELTEEERKAAEEKVVCYLSKKSVPISDTVEVKYNDDGFFRVQKHLMKF